MQHFDWLESLPCLSKVNRLLLRLKSPYHFLSSNLLIQAQCKFVLKFLLLLTEFTLMLLCHLHVDWVLYSIKFCSVLFCQLNCHFWALSQFTYCCHLPLELAREMHNSISIWKWNCAFLWQVPYGNWKSKFWQIDSQNKIMLNSYIQSILV